MLQEAQGLSLQDLGALRSSTMRHRRRYDDEVHQSEHMSRAQQRRNLDHPSSLRSLVSASEPNSLALQEDIMRQITNEGLLDGIDLNNLTQEQEEEITERIAHAFRARQREDARHRRRWSPRDRPSSSAEPDPDMNPHPSRPRILDDLEDRPRRRHRRTSSQVSQTSVRSAYAATTFHDALHSPNLLQPANRSATDLSPSAYDPLRVRERPHSNSTRRVTDPDYRNPDSPSPRALHASIRPSSRRDLYLSSQSLHPSDSHTRNVTNHSTTSLQTLPSGTRPTNNSSPALPSFTPMRESLDGTSRPATSSVVTSLPALATPRPVLSSVSCASCETPNIQHSLHYHCTKCSSGNFDLCIDCYRAGKGCLHWYGFGYAALARYERLAATPEAQPSEHEKPHVLSARRYHPTSALLEEGFFCEGCLSFADACYWHCDICNDGAWGFCNDCVQKAQHCTHPLQCVGRLPATSHSSSGAEHDTAQVLRPAPLNTTKSAFHFLTTSHTSAMSSANLPNASDPSLYTILTPAVYCDICERSIPPSNTRFHCHACNDGNYDICTPCYRAMGSSGRMRPDAQDWRRCPRGHRMSIVGFEDREGGPRRLVVRDFAGGWALKEDGPDGAEAYRSGPVPTGQWKWKEEDGTPAIQTSAARQAAMNLVPPDGGVGLRTQALWSRFPAEGVPDELAFPRNAIVTEVENINGDWYWGVYAGKKGLFPGNFVRII